MRGYLKTLLISITVINSIIALLFAAIAITMIVEEWGNEMGNEAFGYFSTAAFFALLFTTTSIALWFYIYKRIKRDAISSKK